MKNCIKIECRRAFSNRGMLASLVIGVLIVAWHQWQYVLPIKVINEESFCPESVFYNWIGASSFSLQSYLFFLIIPLLAVMPAGSSYHKDLGNGYDRQFFLRGQKKSYLFAKYAAVFLSGGVAVVFPLLLDFAVTALQLPLLKPEPIMSLGPDAGNIGFSLYYEHPMVHTVVFLVIDFLFAGGIAGICLFASFYSDNKYMVLIAPFAMYFFVFSMDNLLGGQSMISPNHFLVPGFEKPIVAEYVIGLFVLLLFAACYWWKGNHYE
ncbi:MAG: hypothetical protein MR316_07345 [Lachnospiraceae bacterium]|nr:hypothetical protein [Lachnospiraceae bacterium]